MTNGAKLIRFAVILICTVIIVYLSWIGAKYVFYKNVILDITDNFMAWLAAGFITKELVVMDDKLRGNGGK